MNKSKVKKFRYKTPLKAFVSPVSSSAYTISSEFRIFLRIKI